MSENHAVAGETPILARVPVDLSVVIPVYNPSERLYLNLPSLLSVLANTVNSFEVVLVDDRSTSSLVSKRLHSLSKEHANTRVIYLDKNIGQVGATLEGFRHSHGRLICTLDDDFAIDPITLSVAVAEFSAKPNVDCVQGVSAISSYPLVRRLRTRFLIFILRPWSLRTPTGTQIASFRLLRDDVARKMTEDVIEYPYMHLKLAVLNVRYTTLEVHIQQSIEVRSRYRGSKALREVWRVIIFCSVQSVREAKRRFKRRSPVDARQCKGPIPRHDESRR
jgi:glycosyltransferase involved in cell wall biosynthesis